MLRNLALAAVCLLGLFSASCVSATHALFDTNTVHEPPRRSPDNVFWWEDTVKTAPLDFIAVFAEATIIHQREGSSATYLTAGTQVTMGSTYKSAYRTWYRVPCPPPMYAEDWIKQRLKGYTRPGKPDPYWQIADAEDCKGCTKERALAIWTEATAHVANRRVAAGAAPAKSKPAP